MAASGTFGFGEEYASLVDLQDFGAIVVKGLTLQPRKGNPPPHCGNSRRDVKCYWVANRAEIFLSRELPRLEKSKAAVIVNIAGDTEEDYIILARELSAAGGGLLALELNVSCPNVKKGGILFGTSPIVLAKLVEKVRSACSLPLIVKLTPNVTDITETARAAENSGADILSLVNTFQGMVIDIASRRPFLGNGTGAFRPCYQPLAWMVYDVYNSVKIPSLGWRHLQTGR